MLVIFLWAGIIWDIFQVSGKTPQSIQFLKIILNGSVITESQISSILIEMWSWPCALLTFSFLIIFRISSFLMLSANNLLLVLKIFLEGNILLLLIGVHWEAKKSLKRLAFSMKSDTILLFIKRGGIKGPYCLYRMNLKSTSTS